MARFFAVNPGALVIWTAIAIGSCSTAWYWYGKVRAQHDNTPTVTRDLAP